MRVPLINLAAQYETIKSEIDHVIHQVLSSGNYIGGSHIQDFEQAFAKKSKANYCVSLANGTDALYIALRALGIQKGDEVITTALSWLSTASTILQVGAKPVFVDIDENGGLINTGLIENKITNNTKAIIPVHLHGRMSNMLAIKKICDQHDLLCIEDSSQSHFTNHNGVFPGQLSDIATYSFYPTKNLGAYGDAGCITTDDQYLADKCRMLTNYGDRGNQTEVGINSRMDTMQAAILNVKMKYAEQWAEKRRNIAMKYHALLKDVPQVVTPSVATCDNHTFYTYTIRCQKRDQLKDYLKKHSIDTTIHYPEILPLLPLFRHLGGREEDFLIASLYQHQTLSLPVYPEISDEQIDYVAARLRDFYN